MHCFETIVAPGHEQVLVCQDSSAGYRGIIAVHSTALGPALGGTRVLRYEDEEAALRDALRLSRAMTYKTALAGMPAGGGKAVILEGDAPLDREALFLAHGRFVDRLEGRFITGEDVGTTPADMAIARRATRYVAGLTTGAGDPAPYTARGVLRAMQAAAWRRFGRDDLRGRRIALQGCGAVGRSLAQALHERGARLVVSDVDPARACEVARAAGGEVVDADAILRVEADILAPCALGGVLNDDTIPALRVGVVVGAANNQLLEERHGGAIEARGILYVPDYVANAGGVLSGGMDVFGWTPAEVARRIDGIYDTVLAVLEAARAEGVPASEAADRLVERRLRGGRASVEGTV